METLEKTVRLKPEHISAYSLIIEEGTPFYEMYGEAAAPRGSKELPTEEEDRLMYGQTKAFLAEAGYGRYEISNYSLPGFACRHNISYWERTDYAGFGLGAASLLENVRWSNTPDRRQYMEASGTAGLVTPLKQAVQHLSRQEQMEEFMFLGLRMTEGVSSRRFYREFHIPLEEVYREALRKLMSEGLLVCGSGAAADGEDSRYRLTEWGIDVSNYALSEFLFA